MPIKKTTTTVARKRTQASHGLFFIISFIDFILLTDKFVYCLKLILVSNQDKDL